MRERRSHRNSHRVRLIVLALMMFATGAYGYWSAEELRTDKDPRRVTLAFQKSVHRDSDLRGAIAIVPRSSTSGEIGQDGNLFVPEVFAERVSPDPRGSYEGTTTSSLTPPSDAQVTSSDRFALGPGTSTFVVAGRSQAPETHPGSAPARRFGAGLPASAEGLMASAEDAASDDVAQVDSDAGSDSDSDASVSESQERADQALDRAAERVDRLAAQVGDREVAERLAGQFGESGEDWMQTSGATGASLGEVMVASAIAGQTSGSTTRQVIELEGQSGDWGAVLSTLGSDFDSAVRAAETRSALAFRGMGTSASSAGNASAALAGGGTGGSLGGGLAAAGPIGSLSGQLLGSVGKP